MAQDARKYKNPQPVVPGRAVDWQTGGQNPDIKRIFDLLRELERTKAEFGGVDPDVSATATNDDVLIFDGSTGEWTNIPKTQLLAVDDLTNATETSTADGNFLVFYDSAWRNQNFTTGSLGVNADNDADTMLAHVFAVRDDPNTTWFNGVTSNVHSGARGWHLSKEKTEGTPHGWTWHVDGAPCWEIGMDFDTNNAFNSGFGNADFVLAFDHSTTSPTTGADVLRISPAEASTSVAAGVATKFSFGQRGGSPAANSEAFLFAGGTTATSLGGMRISYWSSGVARFALALINAHGTNKNCLVNFQDFWYVGNDLTGSGAQSFHIWDQVAAAERLRMDSTGRLRIGAGAPTAYLHLPAGTATASTAPLKFVAGTNLTSPEAGVFEFDGTDFFATPSATRLKLVLAATSPNTYTQTYSTADRTIANPAAAALTHGVGTADGTVDDVTAAFDQTILNNNFRELTDQVANLVADVLDLKQGLTAVIDDLQTAKVVA